MKFLPKKEKGKAEKSSEDIEKGLKKGHERALEVGRGLKKGLHKEDKDNKDE